MGKRMRWVVGGLLFLILAVLIFILIFPPLGPGDNFAFFVRVLNASPGEVGQLSFTIRTDAGQDKYTSYSSGDSYFPSGTCKFYRLPADATDRLAMKDAEGNEYSIATYSQWRLRESVVVVITESAESGLQGHIFDEDVLHTRSLEQSISDR